MIKNKNGCTHHFPLFSPRLRTYNVKCANPSGKYIFNGTASRRHEKWSTGVCFSVFRNWFSFFPAPPPPVKTLWVLAPKSEVSWASRFFSGWKHLRGWLERLIWYCLYFILMFSHTCNTHLYTDTHVRMQANACEFVLNWKLECWENIYSCSDCSKNVVLSRNR